MGRVDNSCPIVMGTPLLFTVKRQNGQQYLKFRVGVFTLSFVINLTKHDKIAFKKGTQNTRNRKITRIKFR